MSDKNRAMPKIKKAVKIVDNNVNSFRSLNNQQKTITGIGSFLAIGFAGFILYKGYKAVSNGFGFITGQKSDEEKAAEKNLIVNYKTQLTNQTEKPTISPEQASLLASRILEAFLNHGGLYVDKLFDSGTDEDEVFAVLSELKNKSDWLLLSATYRMPRNRGLVNELGYELNLKELAKAKSILSKINVKI